MIQQQAICAVATPSGVGAIAVIRVSGLKTFDIVNRIFKGKNLHEVPSHTVHFGTIRDNDTIIDEVLITVFKNPKSFTKEDVVEIACHGSDYIIQKIIQLLIREGASLAQPGEFTQRAFLNGQFDLVQAEAVADLIAADSAAAHRTALTQMRGGFSKQLALLRDELIHFASLVELELDFGEEDVEFAERDDLKRLIVSLQANIKPLIDSFDFGNALKDGIPVAIIGAPNVGKSTLLNALLNEEKAIVTPIAGTTRDIIEDILFIDGIKFRIIDTAGIRETDDLIESIGIERSKQAIEKADLVLILSPLTASADRPEGVIEEFSIPEQEQKKVINIVTKIDLANNENKLIMKEGWIGLSAKTGIGLDELRDSIKLKTQNSELKTIVTNARHYQHLTKTYTALDDVLTGLESGVTGDFLAQDIRLALFELGQITGTIATEDLLKNIFGKFCIGK
jgi:tRNA modification GTPase